MEVVNLEWLHAQVLHTLTLGIVEQITRLGHTQCTNTHVQKLDDLLTEC